MHSLLRIYIFFCISVLVISTPLEAQISQGGEPYSFSHQVAGNPPVVTMGAVDVAALLAEDAAEQLLGAPRPPRFGYGFSVNLAFETAGQWTALENGDRLWRLRIASQGAYSINLTYNDFFMPPGASFFLYNQDRSDVRGAFTEKNNMDHGQFSTAPIPGSIITLEYYEPRTARGKGRLQISTVVHAYQNIFDTGLGHGPGGYGASSSCNTNVNCSEGSPWEDQKRSVALITLDDGTRLCTGSLINNEWGNLTPYFLTAEHCMIGNPNTWMFIFNYESPTCSNIDVSTSQSISGATIKSSSYNTDFALLSLSTKPPPSYNTYYSGWSAVSSPASSTAAIHHPHGDIKKISFDHNQAVSSSWPGRPAASHWEVYFDQGTVEHGSSGSPLFDQNRRIVGQLHGNINPLFTGTNYCEVPNAWYGKLSMSWAQGSDASTRLRDWLDPSNTGALFLDGREGPSLTAYITGDVNLQASQPGSWTVHPSGGSGSYSYSWSYKPSGSSYWHSPLGSGFDATWSTYFCSDPMITLMAHVTSGVENIYPTFNVYIDGSDPNCTDGPWSGWGSQHAMMPSNEDALPSSFEVLVGPNPSDTRAYISVALPEAVSVQIVIYDVAGREVARITNGYMEAGFHRVPVETALLPSGIYIYGVTAGSDRSTGRLAIVR